MPRDVRASDPDDDRSVEEHLRDASLAATVKLALADRDELRLLDVEPEVRRGVVILHGDAPSIRHYALAEQVVRGVAGVRGVRNAISAPGAEPIPTAAPELAEAPAMPSDTAGAQQPTAEGRVSAEPAAQSDSAAESAPTAVYHTVASGESLWIIARENDTSVDVLKRLNNLESNRLRPGQRLRVR